MKITVDNLIKLAIILLSIICIIFAIASSSRLTVHELPRDNFVNLKLIINKTNGSEFISVASGFAYRTIDDSTYILSAQHFCMPIDEIDNLAEVIAANITVTSFNNIKAVPVFIDIAKDLCLLKIDKQIIKNMNISATMPIEGDKVLALSAPRGISEEGVVLQFEGFYSGCNINDMCYFTIPSTEGSSGSVILNQKGEIVSMIQMTAINFNSVSLGVRNSSIILFLRNASAKLGVDLL